MSHRGWSALVAAGLTGSAAMAAPMLRPTPAEAPALPDARTVPCELSCSADYEVVLRDFDGRPMTDVTVRGCGDREVTDDIGSVTMSGRASSSDPLVFIQWFAIAAALLFWGRGAYCGWLCPFGALQELTNKIARALNVPQVTLPWGLHERLWAVKYMIFLGLFGLSMVSIPLAETYAEVEPFKTAIILKFVRDWPFVVFALALLLAGLFIERFYCRYLCPLGAALAIPARIRMFDWLKRYKECGTPCQTCANECPVQAIHPTGEINPNECVNCLHCQVLYQSNTKCPVVIRQLKRRAKVGSGELKVPTGNAPANHPNAKPTTSS